MAGSPGSPFRELKVDRAVYLLDRGSRTYRFLRRNPDWRALDPRENEQNKRALDGCTRIFSDGRRKVFRYGSPSSRGAPR